MEKNPPVKYRIMVEQDIREDALYWSNKVLEVDDLSSEELKEKYFDWFIKRCDSFRYVRNYLYSEDNNLSKISNIRVEQGKLNEECSEYEWKNYDYHKYLGKSKKEMVGSANHDSKYRIIIKQGIKEDDLFWENIAFEKYDYWPSKELKERYNFWKNPRESFKPKGVYDEYGHLENKSEILDVWVEHGRLNKKTFEHDWEKYKPLFGW